MSFQVEPRLGTLIWNTQFPDREVKLDNSELRAEDTIMSLKPQREVLWSRKYWPRTPVEEEGVGRTSSKRNTKSSLIGTGNRHRNSGPENKEKPQNQNSRLVWLWTPWLKLWTLAWSQKLCKISREWNGLKLHKQWRGLGSIICIKKKYVFWVPP